MNPQKSEGSLLAASGRAAQSWAVIVATTLLAVPAALAAAEDLDRAGGLVREGKYQQAYDLLLPSKDAHPDDAEFAYVLGRAALGAGRVEEAQALLERSLELRPDSVDAHLALGRALFAQGKYGQARLEFETVLQFDNLPQDLLTQVEIYDQAAEQYLDGGSRLTRFGYAETGFGGYRTNSTRGSTGGDQDSTFFNARVGGGIDYLLSDGYALDANLDYRFRYHDESGVRNDSDLRWRAAGSRSIGDDNLAAGFRGRVSYRGNGDYRNDYSIFTTYRHQIDEDDQLSFGAEVRRRRYPHGSLRARSRTTADANVGWTRVVNDQATFSMTGHVGRNYATSRPNGDSTIYGAIVDLDYTFSDSLGWYIFGWWERDVFNTDAYHFHPDEEDTVILRREDNLYEFGTSLVWSFGSGWTFRPEVLYIRDERNATNFNYSATEFWINVRKGF
jgi:tetratricopeptide (TPR) repeat protein